MIPFFTILFGIIEVGLIMYTESVLSGRLYTFSRELRTGAVRGIPITDIKTLLCTRTGLSDCATNLHVHIAPMSGTVPDSIVDGNFNLGSDSFSIGSAGDIVIIRISYEYDFLFPYVGPIMSNLNNGNFLIEFNTAIRAEG